ncbi:hypothetical protein [Arthrobacter sp.]|uniref:hypothetical protein n=1 Tax=Arthrobacter sp. TaxID=1667 RepID=UPI002810AF98|nr:hypothetical protein [Arthrobacter sp.]
MVFGFHVRDDGAGRQRVLPVMCGNCGTDRRLIIRSVFHLPGEPPEVALESYTCSRCGTFNEHPAQVADLSQVLARPEQTRGRAHNRQQLHALRTADEKGRFRLRKLAVPLSTEDGAEDALGVYLSTRVLTCVCGFQMELPE